VQQLFQLGGIHALYVPCRLAVGKSGLGTI
jgi:hypothetical protein